MAAKAPTTSPEASPGAQPAEPGPDRPPERPWRTEGLPKARPPIRRQWWITAAMWMGGYLLLFGVLTIQDRLSGPEPVPYTEFKAQVANKNVAELFARGDSIEGQLRK